MGGSLLAHYFFFERLVISTLLATKNQTKTAELLGTSFEVVHAIMKDAVERGLQRRQDEDAEIEFLCIDEKAVFSGHHYISIMSDPTGKYVIDVVEHRTLESSIALLQTLSPKQQSAVKAVAMDMWQNYQAAVAEVLPQAEIVHDKFHVVKKLNEGVDETRRIEKNPALKKLRYAFFKSKESLNEKQKQTFEELNKLNLKTSQAWRLKETFKDLFYLSKFDDFYGFFIQWLAEVMDSGIKPMIKVAKTIKNHINGVLNIFKYKLTNSAAEGLNAKIKEINIIGKGYRSFKNIRNAILFYNANLNLFPHF